MEYIESVTNEAIDKNKIEQAVRQVQAQSTWRPKSSLEVEPSSTKKGKGKERTAKGSSAKTGVVDLVAGKLKANDNASTINMLSSDDMLVGFLVQVVRVLRVEGTRRE